MGTRQGKSTVWGQGGDRKCSRPADSAYEELDTAEPRRCSGMRTRRRRVRDMVGPVSDAPTDPAEGDREDDEDDGKNVPDDRPGTRLQRLTTAIGSIDANRVEKRWMLVLVHRFRRAADRGCRRHCDRRDAGGGVRELVGHRVVSVRRWRPSPDVPRYRGSRLAPARKITVDTEQRQQRADATDHQYSFDARRSRPRPAA